MFDDVAAQRVFVELVLFIVVNVEERDKVRIRVEELEIMSSWNNVSRLVETGSQPKESREPITSAGSLGSAPRSSNAQLACYHVQVGTDDSIVTSLSGDTTSRIPSGFPAAITDSQTEGTVIVFATCFPIGNLSVSPAA